MPREVLPIIAALVGSNTRQENTLVQLTLRDSTVLRFSTAELVVDEEVFLALLTEDVGELHMSLDPEVDGMEFEVTNANLVVGQIVSEPDAPLAGAGAIVGSAFEEPLTGDIFYDAKMAGVVVVGDVSDSDVQFEIVSVLDATTIGGRTFGSVFTWREPISRAPEGDPNDLLRGGGDFSGGGGDRRLYGDYNGSDGGRWGQIDGVRWMV